MPRKKTASKTPRKSPRRAPRKTTTKKPRPGRLRSAWFWGWIFRLSLAAVVVMAVYAAYLDYQIRNQFEGKRWSLPAHVYARPLELYQGKSLTAPQLEHELTLLGYRKRAATKAPGSYSRQGATFDLYTRSFRFPDTEEPARRFRISLNNGHINSLAGSRSMLDLVRLEPVRVGGIYPAHNEDRVLLQLTDVPETFIKALIAVEDRSYYQHHGLAPLAILRALWINLKAGRVVQGGSTLTQQLVKNYFLSNERTLARKFDEAIMALLLEWHYDKQAVLEAYLNEVYLGQDRRRAIHGLGLASHFYFGLGPQQLELHHIALLVGMIKGPSYYNPRRHPQRATQRRNLVLDLMVGQGVVAARAAARAKRQPLGVIDISRGGITDYPAFLDLVRRQLRRDYRDEDLASEGLRIFTTLDPWVQAQAEQALEHQIKALGGKQRRLQGAVVVSSVEGGEVLAAVGGRDPRYAGFNRALDAVRPIGSLVKPAVYLTALEQPESYSLVSRLQDQPLSLDNPDGSQWTPQNYDHEFVGELPLHQALAESRNLPTVYLGLELGVDRVIRSLHRLGVERDIKPYPSLFLGALSLTPLEVTQMYQTLANGGFRAPLRAIRAVQAADGRALQRYPLEVKQAFDPAPVYLTDTILQEVVQRGTARSLRHMLGRELRAAGKTGTTDDLRDSWFAGFTGEHLAVVWMGRDDNSKAGLTGASGALRVWGDMMQRLTSSPLQPIEPPGIEWGWVDGKTGLLSSRACQGAEHWPFIRGNMPRAGKTCLRGQALRGFDWLRETLDGDDE